MKKDLVYFLFPILMLTFWTSFAQSDTTKKKIRIISADQMIAEQINGEWVDRLVGNVQVEHDSTMLYCDSAYNYRGSNTIKAFSRVRAEMQRGTTLKCNELEYDGNTKIGEAVGAASINNKKSILTSDRLTYYRGENYGFFNTGGKLVDEKTTLTSQTGYYYPNENMAHFKQNVVLINPDFTLKTDTLGYDTQKDMAIFMAKTNIVSKKGEVINTESGTYETKTKRLNFTSRTNLEDKDNIVTADSIDYHDDTQIAYMNKNVVLRQKDNKLEITGDYGVFYKNKDESMITQNPRAVLRGEKDTTIITSDTLFALKRNGKDLGIAKNNVRLTKPDNSLEITGGYATFYKETEESMITQTPVAIFRSKEDTTTIFSDTLITQKRNGKDVGIARHNVRLVQADSTLKVRGENGLFYRDTDESIITGKVIADILQKNDTLQITCDTLIAQKKNEEQIGIARGNVHVTQADSSLEVFGNRGVFYKDKEESNIVGNTLAIQKTKDNTMYIAADSLYSKQAKQNKFGVATGNVILQEGDSTLEVRGGRCLFYQDRQESLMSDNPMAIQRFDKDTLFITADTLYAVEDTITKKRNFRAWNHVNIFMKDLQGVCDSLVYFNSDSMIVLYRQPMLWSDSSQLSGDTVTIWMKNKKVDSMLISVNGFLVSQEDTVGFNQIKGKEIRVKFAENKLQKMHVVGNSESLYFIKDDKKGGYQGVNSALSLEMFIFLKENKANKIIFKGKTDGSYSPLYEVLDKENKLEGMIWKPEKRPKKPNFVPINILSRAN
ncbi:MAG: OstA-like protein [Bacteroidia bacterium]